MYRIAAFIILVLFSSSAFAGVEIIDNHPTPAVADVAVPCCGANVEPVVVHGNVALPVLPPCYTPKPCCKPEPRKCRRLVICCKEVCRPRLVCKEGPCGRSRLGIGMVKVMKPRLRLVDGH